MSTSGFVSTMKHPLDTKGTFLSSEAEPIGATARVAAEVKQKALVERNAAKDRM
jgi:hypothetical protein